MNSENTAVVEETTDQPEVEAKQVANEAAEPVEGEQEESATSEESQSERRNKGVGKRINELTREKYEAIRRAEALEAELTKARQQQATPAQQTRDKPTLESCGYDPERYAEEVAEWKIEQSFAKREAAYREAQQRKAIEEKVGSFQKKVADLEAISPGAWEKAVNAPINTTEPMLEIIRDSDVGPHIAVWLAENLEEAESISRMSPLRAAARLGQIEASIASSLSKPRATTSKAPPPPPKVAGNAKVDKSPETMTMAEFAAWRNSQEKRR